MKPNSFSFESMGTLWQISIWDKISPAYLETLRKEIATQAERFDSAYSRFIPSSLVSLMAKKTGVITVPDDFMQMLRLYIDLYPLSNKKLTPLVGAALEDMGYDKSYSLKPQPRPRKVPELVQTVKIIDGRHIEIKKPVLFDFGALGKGYFVELIKNMLLEKKICRFLVNGSGDVTYIGDNQPISIGLEHPFDHSTIVARVSLNEGAMCSSGINRRSWGQYHHIIDPQSLVSPSEVVATWVTATSATIADALATALFLVSPDQFYPDYKFEYFILNKEMKVKRSPGFIAELY